MRQVSTLQRLLRGHGCLIKGDGMTELVLDAFVKAAVIAVVTMQEMDRIYLKTAL